MIGAAPQTLAGAMNSQQWNPAFGMGLIPHLNSGNVFNPGSPNAQFDVLTGRMGAQSSWAANMPGVAPQYNPNVAIHHGLNLPGGMGQFKDPGMLHGFGQGCKCFRLPFQHAGLFFLSSCLSFFFLGTSLFFDCLITNSPLLLHFLLFFLSLICYRPTSRFRSIQKCVRADSCPGRRGRSRNAILLIFTFVI